MDKPAKLNEPCYCGSGKRYKHCHFLRARSVEADPLGWADVSLARRNRILISAAEDIFGFRKGRTWQEFKSKIADEEIREFFKVHGSMWGPETNWVGIMPKPGDGKLRGLYLGDVRPELILRNLLRFSLYNDQILVIDPFPNARNIKPKYNPIDNPHQYKAEMIKLIYFLFQIKPWIENELVQLIPDPGDIDRELKWDTVELAQSRRAGLVIDEADLAEVQDLGQQDLGRFLSAMDDQSLLGMVKKSGQSLSGEQERKFLDYMRRQLREDPLALNQPVGRRGQLTMMRGGTNIETALLISNVTGAFPYTSMRTRWQEIMSVSEELSETARIWSPLAKTFHSLDFKFLNNVDVEFAKMVREDGRLEGFRGFLRSVGKGATEISSLSSQDNFVRDTKDALIGEHQKATAEWDKIQNDFAGWAGAGLAGAFLGGHIIPDVAALSAGVVATLGQLFRRHLKRAHFRKTNPLSVFIDLSEKEPKGKVLV
ncbi:SEC-C metal-binding domain-containing protein [Bradyrhizobium sp. 164]|uniref:SEC-C domain-containing protein n=1 Tax=Bradyrhizobium sp. 164 TaxID=2782637 RepID=UPI001FFAA3DE|nr:SEC-C metal-binding domain-containing protein [Bradyrhizobium sp. 164]MCK1595884.1 SEC-C domain-containing protein [Bradyrhizobium sp. 164]